jgi:hypothetical protein
VGFETVRTREEDAFVPSSVIERLVLQVIGGWELVRAYVNFSSFTEAGPEREWAGAKSLAKAMRQSAEDARVRYPHDEWSTVADEVNRVRQRFAHFLYINDITGEYPNRTLTFTRLGESGEPYGRRGEALGLKWRDDEWAQQSRHEDSITEQELRDTLAKEQWLIHCCRAVRRLGGILENSPDLPDDHPAMGSGWWIPWVLPEWQDGRTTLYVRDIRLP